MGSEMCIRDRAEISLLHKELGVTTIYVTHDQVEAMTLGDRVAVMRDGVLQQVGAPNHLYARPANLFVAEFIGSPAMNLVGADVARENGAVTVTFGEHRLRVDRPELSAHDGRRLILGVRPEDLEDAALAAGDQSLESVVDIREDLGSEVFVHFAVGGPPVRGEDVQAAVGEDAVEATSVQARTHGSLWVARVGRESGAREGEKLRVAIDGKRLHFFDPDSGDAIR